MNQRDDYSSSHGFDDTRDRGYEAGPQGRGRQWGRSDWDAGPRSQGSHGQGPYRQDQGRGNDWERERHSGRAPYGSGQHTHWQDAFGRPQDTHYYGTGAPGWGGPGYTGGAYGYGTSPRDLGYELEAEYSDESAVSYERPRRYARGPKGYQRSDERIKEDISERLWAAHFIDSSDVTVEVKGGVVTLDGTVPNRYMRHVIENIADRCLGVQDIDNRVRVKNQQLQSQSQTTATSSALKTRQ
jgi:hypothetical protein